MNTAYLAGPDVFRPDSVAHFARLKRICKHFGFKGVSPYDAEPPTQDPANIRSNNMGLIRSCDIVLANVSPFRGPNADDGTAFEIGFAVVLGIPVLCYSDDKYTTLLERRTNNQCSLSHGRDQNGWIVEDFKLPVNLMLFDSFHGGIHHSIDAALAFYTQKVLATS